MPRTKGSKNKKSLTVDYAALIAEKQAEKDFAVNINEKKIAKVSV